MKCKVEGCDNMALKKGFNKGACVFHELYGNDAEYWKK